jgi:Leucine-rich repeat (LRR) protein
LDRLCAEHTHLTNLPEFPRRLTTLSLSHNWNLTKLPELPPSLNQLHIPHNAIRTIPALPPDMYSLIYHVDT